MKKLEVLELGKGVSLDVEIPFNIKATTEDIKMYGGKENVKALVADIMERYANASYFDVEGLIEKGDMNVYPAGCDRDDCRYYQVQEKFSGKCQECLENCHRKGLAGINHFEEKET